SAQASSKTPRYAGRALLVAQRHPLLRLREWSESYFGVQLVRVGRGEQDAAQAMWSQVVVDGGDKRRAQPLAAGGAGDVDIAQPAECGVIGDHPRVSDLGTGGAAVDTEVQ